MKCSYFPKEERRLWILLVIVFFGGFLTELYQVLMGSSDGENWLTVWAFLAGAVACITAYCFSRKSCIIVDEEGIAFSHLFQKNRFFRWENMKFVAKYYMPHSIRGVWGILFSFDIDEYDIKGNIKYQELLVSTEKSDHFCTITYYSEKLEKALKKYVPYSKMVKKELKYEDFGFGEKVRDKSERI